MPIDYVLAAVRNSLGNAAILGILRTFDAFTGDSITWGGVRNFR